MSGSRRRRYLGPPVVLNLLAKGIIPSTHDNLAKPQISLQSQRQVSILQQLRSEILGDLPAHTSKWGNKNFLSSSDDPTVRGSKRAREEEFFLFASYDISPLKKIKFLCNDLDRSSVEHHELRLPMIRLMVKAITPDFQVSQFRNCKRTRDEGVFIFAANIFSLVKKHNFITKEQPLRVDARFSTVRPSDLHGNNVRVNIKVHRKFMNTPRPVKQSCFLALDFHHSLLENQFYDNRRKRKTAHYTSYSSAEPSLAVGSKKHKATIKRCKEPAVQTEQTEQLHTIENLASQLFKPEKKTRVKGTLKKLKHSPSRTHEADVSTEQLYELEILTANLQHTEEFDAQRVFGYALFKDGKNIGLSYPLEKFHFDSRATRKWRSFYNGRFIQRMPKKAATLPEYVFYFY